MEFEIYMPCEPDWVCDSLLWLFALLFIAGILGFIVIVYREHHKINAKLSRYKRRKNQAKQRRK